MQTSHFLVLQASTANLRFLCPFTHNDPWISWVSFYCLLTVTPETKAFVAFISLYLRALPLLQFLRLRGTFVWVQFSLTRSEWWWNLSFIHTFSFLHPFFPSFIVSVVHDLSLVGSIFPNFLFFAWEVLLMILFVSSFIFPNTQILDQGACLQLSVLLLQVLFTVLVSSLFALQQFCDTNSRFLYLPQVRSATEKAI